MQRTASSSETRSFKRNKWGKSRKRKGILWTLGTEKRPISKMQANFRAMYFISTKTKRPNRWLSSRAHRERLQRTSGWSIRRAWTPSKKECVMKQTEDKNDHCEKNGHVSPPPPLSEKPPTSPVQINKKISKIYHQQFYKIPKKSIYYVFMVIHKMAMF